VSENGYHREIGKVTDTELGWESHGILTVYLRMDYGHSGQSIGGYCLDKPIHEDGAFKGRIGSAYGMEFVRRLIKACGVEKWEDVKGRTVFVLRESDRLNAKVLGVENLPTERGERFLFSDLEPMAVAEEDSG
jgi:hypothetical protein